MKKLLLLLFFATSAFFVDAQLITNGDFEATASTYTVVESSTNVLKRVTNYYDAATLTTLPTLTASDAVATGQWVKRDASTTPNAGFKAIVTTSDFHTGTSSLNLKIASGITTAGYDKYINAVALQKINGSLSNTSKYVVTFWAKLDGTANNNCTSITAMLVDNVARNQTNPLSSTAILVNGTTWTKYTLVMDVPKFVAFNATANFATAYMGFGINTTYTTATTPATNYSGVLIDDISISAYSASSPRYVKQVATGTGDGTSWANASSDIIAMLNDIQTSEIQVAAGTYYPSSTIYLRDGVNLIGGYAADGSGTRDIWNNQTILDGSGNKRLLTMYEFGSYFYNITKVDGFILQNGTSDYGSAARLTVGSVLENCIIRNNTGTAFGSAVYFTANRVCSTSNNNSKTSGALINCLIINNTSTGGSGAVYSTINAHFGLVNCVIANNKCTETTTGVGGVYIGSSIHYSQIQNSILYNNSGASAVLNNIKNATAGALRTTLHNWFDNTSAEINISTQLNLGAGSVNNVFKNTIATPNFALPTTFQGAATTSAQVAELEASDWRLKSTSGLISLGNSTQGLKFPYENMNPNTTALTGRAYADIATDIMGSNRIINTTNDLGAYEYNPVVVTTANGTNGTAAGGITVSKGTSVALTSTPANGYRLADWTNGATVVSTSPTYTFIPTAASTIQANFASNTVSVGAATNASSLVNCENCDITVGNGGTLTIDETKTVNSVTISGGGRIDNTSATAKTLTVTSDLTLESDGNGTATYVEKNNGALVVTGTTTVKQLVTSAETGLNGRNWYVSSPVAAAISSSITTLTGNGLVSYNESTGLWEDAGTTMQVAKGYIVKSFNGGDKTVSFAGTGGLNTGNLSTDFGGSPTLTRSDVNKGFNLIGNPYPSYVSWDATTRTNVGTSIWYRSKKSGAYVFQTYNVSGAGVGVLGGTNLIPPLQSFWVRVDADKTTGTVAFTNDLRSHQDQNNVDNRLKVKAVTTQKLLRLQVSNQVNADEAVVYFNDNAANGFDSFDSPKMSNGDVAIPEIYTSIGANQLVINGMNSIESNLLIPLGFKTGANNNFTIKATEIVNFDADTKILLVDNVLNTEKDISNGAEYSFSSDVTNNANRFSILFRSPSISTGIKTEKNNQLLLSVFKNAYNQMIINSNIDKQGTVTICNAIGQKVLITSTTGLSTVINNSFSSGVYFVTVFVAGNKATQKVIID